MLPILLKIANEDPFRNCDENYKYADQRFCTIFVKINNILSQNLFIDILKILNHK